MARLTFTLSPTAAGKRRALMMAVIIGILTPPVQSMSQTRDVEARVRERASSFWEAMKNNDYENAVQFLHPSYRKVFSHELPKSRVIAWKLEKVECNADLTECDTAMRVTKPFPVMSDTVDWPLRNQWVLDEGEWYLRLPWKEGENPFLRMFADRENVARTVTVDDSRPSPASPSGSPGTADREMRISSDPGNAASVRFGEKAIYRFNYTNRGKSPLRIISIHSDCHCTGVKKDYPEIGPGETGVFEVTLDTFGLPLGNIEKTLLVQFSDLPDPIEVNLRVENLPNFTVAPSSVDFGSIPVGEESGLDVVLVNRSGRTVRIVTVQKLDPRLSVELERQTLAPEEQIRIALRYRAALAGAFVDNLQLYSDLSAEPVINIPIQGHVVAAKAIGPE